MIKLLTTSALALLVSFTGTSQNSFLNDFQNAYVANPAVPAGLLEAVAWSNTHMVHLKNPQKSCVGIPSPYGIMGLFDDGENYFIENGVLIASLSGISVAQQKSSPANQIMAYAKAYSQKLQAEILLGGLITEGYLIRKVVHSLSEIPDSGVVNHLARDMQVYSVLEFMNSPEKAQQYNFSQQTIDIQDVFGIHNYAVLSSSKIRFTPTQILSDNNEAYIPEVNLTKTLEYGPAIWNPSPACNYSSRNGTAISATTIHTTQGSYAGSISWGQNCASNVSWHYIVRSSDGQVTQMVLEADKAWHVGTENSYTIGIEHEGYVDDASWYTTVMYNVSANLSRDICDSGYGIPPLRTYYGLGTIGANPLGACLKIKGHQNFPNANKGDPGVNWDWERYYRLINFDTPFTNITNLTGTFFDSGGPTANYQDDERMIWRFGTPTSTSVTVDFTSFDVEIDYEDLFIYDGDSINDPLIGTWTGTNSPGQITSTGGYLVVEFRSDCGTTGPGWNATYSITEPIVTPVDSIAATTAIIPDASWQTVDFTVDFTDSDNLSGVAEKFYLVGEKAMTENDWHSIGSSRFAYESFEDNANNWFPVTGTFTMNAGAYQFSDVAEQNSNTYMSVAQVGSEIYLYEWDQTITSSGTNQRAGIHFFCDNPNLSNRGYSYFVYLRESDNAVEIFSVDNNVFTSQSYIPQTLNAGQTYNCKVVYNPATGWIKVFIDDVFHSEWQDTTPLTSGGFISLRSGGCAVNFDNVQVYHARNSQANISVTSEMTIESENAVPSGYIKTIILDSVNNLSAPSTSTYLVDLTAPTLNLINDGNSTDIDTFMISTIEANWSIDDIHSSVANYEVAIGTAAGLDDVVAWSSNGITATFSSVLASPVLNQIYFISVRATNNAGLMDEFNSDGQRYVNTASLENIILQQISVYPNPATEFISFSNAPEDFNILLSDAKGKIVIQQNMKGTAKLNVSELAIGSYTVTIFIEDKFIVKRLIIK